jgi:hypothetical protein
MGFEGLPHPGCSMGDEGCFAALIRMPPLAMPPVMHGTILDMTIACLDMLENILIGSRKSNGRHPLSSDILAVGLD